MLHPGAGADVKTWPARRWADITSRLTSTGTVVLTGGPSDEASIAAIRACLGEPPPSVTTLAWDELAALYRRADVVVGMDSGPLHLAAAVGTPTVRVYGPTDPRIYGPATPPGHVVLSGRLPCVPCGNLVAPPCGYLLDPPCLATVAVDEVVAAVRSLLPVASPA